MHFEQQYIGTQLCGFDIGKLSTTLKPARASYALVLSLAGRF
jgi:hypothetical protein